MINSRMESYLVSDVGTCLLLKLTGFIEDCRAEIRAVSENHLHLRMGSTWWEQFVGRGAGEYPLEMEILFVPAEPTERRLPHSRVQIVVRDGRMFSRAERFEVASRRVLWKLRSHLMMQ